LRGKAPNERQFGGGFHGQLGAAGPQGRLQARFHRQDARLVRQGHQRAEEAADQGSDQLALPGGDPRLQPLRGSAEEIERRPAEQLRPGQILEPVPARQLVFPLLAPRLSALVRAHPPQGHRRSRRSKRLGAALLELQQQGDRHRRSQADPARLPSADGRRHFQPALHAGPYRRHERQRRHHLVRRQPRLPEAHPVRRRVDRRQPRLRRHPDRIPSRSGDPGRGRGDPA
jgi:hypothetical protein